MRYGSCYLSERRYVKHVLVTGARAARSPGHVRFNVGQKILRRSLVCALDTDCPIRGSSAEELQRPNSARGLAGPENHRARSGDRRATDAER
jgi:hypothetical protein